MNTTKTAHTPRPWVLQLVESDTGRIRHLCPMDGDGLSLLTVVEHNGKKFAAIYSDDDARLIVAAPDLLKALRDIHAMPGVSQGAAVIASAAIFQATGELP